MGGKSSDEPTWHTASRCEGGQCVQVGTLGDSVLIRNSADPDGTSVTLSQDEWREFLARAKGGDFDTI